MPLDTGSICPVNMKNLAENHCILMVPVFLYCIITLPRDFFSHLDIDLHTIVSEGFST